jgi:hypothetical protein
MPTIPYELPEKLQPNLRQVFFYWESLKRGENEMPFWDSRESMAGKLVDEIQPLAPFDYLGSQCSATVEGRRPTFLHHRSDEVGSRVSCGETAA